MPNPNETGSPAIGAWTLIQQLESKVREKNEIIKSVQEESDDWRRKFILLMMFGKGHEGIVGVLPFVVGGLIGMLVGGGLMWWIVRHT